jgi:hypothetical protein
MEDKRIYSTTLVGTKNEIQTELRNWADWFDGGMEVKTSQITLNMTISFDMIPSKKVRK